MTKQNSLEEVIRDIKMINAVEENKMREILNQSKTKITDKEAFDNKENMNNQHNTNETTPNKVSFALKDTEHKVNYDKASSNKLFESNAPKAIEEFPLRLTMFLLHQEE